MTIEIIALAVGALVSILLPLIILGIIIKMNRQQWKSIFAIFLCGGLVYAAMQWGVKEHGLAWLFNNTSFMDFMDQHYISYLLVVALIGAVLTTIAQVLVVLVLFKRNVSMGRAISFSLGYSMLESTLLMGARSINTIIEIVKGSELTLDTTATELFLSGYERVLLLIIEMAVVVVLVYFIQKKMTIQGTLVATFCYMIVAFLPGFLIAFSLPEYLEVFHRSTALVLVYIVLTATAVASLVILYAFKKLIND